MKPVILVWILVSLIAPSVYAHTEISPILPVETHTILLTTDTVPPEPGTVTMKITTQENGQPLPFEVVNVKIMKRSWEILEVQTVTDENGEGEVKVHLDSAGYYDVKLSTLSTVQEFRVHVHGRGVLVIGFLTAVGILLILLFEKM